MKPLFLKLSRNLELNSRKDRFCLVRCRRTYVPDKYKWMSSDKVNFSLLQIILVLGGRAVKISQNISKRSYFFSVNCHKIVLQSTSIQHYLGLIRFQRKISFVTSFTISKWLKVILYFGGTNNIFVDFTWTSSGRSFRHAAARLRSQCL